MVPDGDIARIDSGGDGKKRSGTIVTIAQPAAVLDTAMGEREILQGIVKQRRWGGALGDTVRHLSSAQPPAIGGSSKHIKKHVCGMSR